MGSRLKAVVVRRIQTRNTPESCKNATQWCTHPLRLSLVRRRTIPLTGRDGDRRSDLASVIFIVRVKQIRTAEEARRFVRHVSLVRDDLVLDVGEDTVVSVSTRMFIDNRPRRPRGDLLSTPKLVLVSCLILEPIMSQGRDPVGKR